MRNVQQWHDKGNKVLRVWRFRGNVSTANQFLNKVTSLVKQPGGTFLLAYRLQPGQQVKHRDYLVGMPAVGRDQYIITERTTSAVVAVCETAYDVAVSMNKWGFSFAGVEKDRSTDLGGRCDDTIVMLPPEDPRYDKVNAPVSDLRPSAVNETTISEIADHCGKSVAKHIEQAVKDSAPVNSGNETFGEYVESLKQKPTFWQRIKGLFK